MLLKYWVSQFLYVSFTFYKFIFIACHIVIYLIHILVSLSFSYLFLHTLELLSDFINAGIILWDVCLIFFIKHLHPFIGMLLATAYSHIFMKNEQMYLMTNFYLPINKWWPVLSILGWHQTKLFIYFSLFILYL